MLLSSIKLSQLQNYLIANSSENDFVKNGVSGTPNQIGNQLLGNAIQKGKDEINKIISESQLDENGNELEFVDKLILKIHEFKEELNEKIEERVIKFYKKINVAHLDEIKALNEKIEKADMAIALLEARLNKLEAQ